MKTILYNLSYGVVALAVTLGMLWLVHYIYFSDATRTFDVIGIVFVVILYSNFMAQMYGRIRVRSL